MRTIADQLRDMYENETLMQSIAACFQEEGFTTTVPEHHGYITICHHRTRCNVYHRKGKLELWQDVTFHGEHELANPNCFKAIANRVKSLV